MHFLAYFSLQGALIMLNTLRKVEDRENHVRWIYLDCSQHGGKSESMREYPNYILGVVNHVHVDLEWQS